MTGRGAICIATASALLALAISAHAADPVCGDVNASGGVTTSDALAVLRESVGQPVQLQCPPPALPLRSGQTACFDDAGDSISCAGSGQDGESQAGVTRSFTDNGDGTIGDNQTGLTWEKLSDDAGIHDQDNVYAWEDAAATKVAALNTAKFAGHDDWRLPNRFELDTLVNLGTASPSTYAVFNSSCAPGCAVTTCSCTQPTDYWSSTTKQSSPTLAWTVFFSNGGTASYSKTSERYVRAVRGGT
jgi:hypothetical protein